MRGRGPMTVDRCRLDPVRELARTTMVMEMLQEEVIEPVGSPLTLFSNEPDRGHWPTLPSIFSTYFLVPKLGGGWRGCLDSRFMNQYVQSIYFKLDSLRTLRDMAMPRDYMIKLDLRHAYLVITTRLVSGVCSYVAGSSRVGKTHPHVPLFGHWYILLSCKVLAFSFTALAVVL